MLSISALLDDQRKPWRWRNAPWISILLPPLSATAWRYSFTSHGNLTGPLSRPMTRWRWMGILPFHTWAGRGVSLEGNVPRWSVRAGKVLRTKPKERHVARFSWILACSTRRTKGGVTHDRGA